MTGDCDVPIPTVAEDPNAERAPWTSRLDLMLDWTREFEGWKLGLYLQVKNLGEADTGETFAGNQSASCIRTDRSDPFCDPSLDEFVPGLSRTEVIGVRVSW